MTTANGFLLSNMNEIKINFILSLKRFRKIDEMRRLPDIMEAAMHFALKFSSVSGKTKWSAQSILYYVFSAKKTVSKIYTIHDIDLELYHLL
jgi:hypothetical protein